MSTLTPSSPNILVLTTDQQRYDSLGFTGNPIVRTPTLDKLASQGVRFTSAFCPSPLCCPTRQTLLTGVMPSVHGGLWNYGICSPIKGLHPGEFATWTESLRKAGYRTAYLGKWHVDPVFDPTAFGYEQFVPEPGVPAEHRRVIREVYGKGGGLSPLKDFPPGMMDTRRLESTPTHVLARKTLSAVRSFAESGKPWHVRLDYSQPHLPCIPAEPFAGMYRPEDIPEWPNFNESFTNKPLIQKRQLDNWGIQDWTWKEWSIYLSGYYGIISQYDHALGILLDELESEGLLANTLIVYSTDHGDAAGSHRMMDKHYVMYEEEVKVPLVVRWDGVVEPGSVCDDLVSNYLDLGPTLLEAASLPVPSTFQGMSMLPRLTGGQPGTVRDHIFSEYNGQQFGLYTQRMIRDRRYKFVWNPTDLFELYDLVADPWELRNLAVETSCEELVREYLGKTYRTFSDLGDRMVQGPWMRYSLTGR